MSLPQNFLYEDITTFTQRTNPFHVNSVTSDLPSTNTARSMNAFIRMRSRTFAELTDVRSDSDSEENFLCTEDDTRVTRSRSTMLSGWERGRTSSNEYPSTRRLWELVTLLLQKNGTLKEKSKKTMKKTFTSISKSSLYKGRFERENRSLIKSTKPATTTCSLRPISTHSKKHMFPRWNISQVRRNRERSAT